MAIRKPIFTSLLIFSMGISSYAQKVIWAKQFKSVSSQATVANSIRHVNSNYSFVNPFSSSYDNRFRGQSNIKVENGLDQELIVAGLFSNNMTIDSDLLVPYMGSIYVAKFDAGGKTLWTNVLGNSNRIYSLKVDKVGNIILVIGGEGIVFSNGVRVSADKVYKTVILKLDKDGKYVNHSTPNALQENSDTMIRWRNKNIMTLGSNGKLYLTMEYRIGGSRHFYDGASAISLLEIDKDLSIKEINNITIPYKNYFTEDCKTQLYSADARTMAYPEIYANQDGSLLWTYIFANKTIVDNDTIQSEYSRYFKDPFADSTGICNKSRNYIIEKAYGRMILKVDSFGNVKNKKTIHLKHKLGIDTAVFSNYWTDSIYTYPLSRKNGSEVIYGLGASIVPLFVKWHQIDSTFYCLMDVIHKFEIEGQEFQVDSVSTVLLSFDSDFNFLKFRNFGSAYKLHIGDIAHDRDKNPVLLSVHEGTMVFDSVQYESTNRVGCVLLSLDKDDLKVKNITGLNDTTGNVIGLTMCNDSYDNLYVGGFFNGLMRVGKTQLQDLADKDRFVVKFGICNTTPRLNHKGVTPLCYGLKDTLKTADVYDEYRWFRNGKKLNSSSANSLTIEEDGWYYLEVDSGECKGISQKVYYRSRGKVDIGNDTLLCNQDSFVIKTKLPYESYVWSNASFSSNTTAKKTGEYHVLVRDKYGCASRDSILLKFIDLKAPELLHGSSLNICSGDSVSLYTSARYKGFQWYRSDTVIPQEKKNLFWAKQAGTYQVRVDSAGCSAISDKKTIEIHPSPAVDLGADIRRCDTEEIELSVRAGYKSYFWSNGIKDQHRIIVKSSGMYSVTAYNNFDCKASDSVKVELEFLGTPSLSLVDDTLFCSWPGPIQWYFNDELLPGENKNFIIPVRKGTYKAKITNHLDCEAVGYYNFWETDGGKPLVLLIRPNPTEKELTVVFNIGKEVTGDIHYRIYDAAGKKVVDKKQYFDSSVSREMTINVEGMTSGMYFTRIKVNEFEQVFKFEKY